MSDGRPDYISKNDWNDAYLYKKKEEKRKLLINFPTWTYFSVVFFLLSALKLWNFLKLLQLFVKFSNLFKSFTTFWNIWNPFKTFLNISIRFDLIWTNDVQNWIMKLNTDIKFVFYVGIVNLWSCFLMVWIRGFFFSFPFFLLVLVSHLLVWRGSFRSRRCNFHWSFGAGALAKAECIKSLRDHFDYI